MQRSRIPSAKHVYTEEAPLQLGASLAWAARRDLQSANLDKPPSSQGNKGESKSNTKLFLRLENTGLMYDGSWASRDQRQREACRQNSVVKRYKKSKVKNQNGAPVKEETLGEQKSEGSLIYRGYTSGSQASRPLNTIPSETLFATVSDFHQPDRVEWQPTAPRDEVFVETNQVQTYYKERSEPLSETDQGYIWKTLMMKGLDSSGFSMTDIDMVRHLPTQFLLAKQFGFLIVNFDDQLKLAGKAKISESKWLEIEGLGVYPSFSELIDVVSSGSVDVLFVMLIVEMV